jgi:hypothetical protein
MRTSNGSRLNCEKEGPGLGAVAALTLSVDILRETCRASSYWRHRIVHYC